MAEVNYTISTKEDKHTLTNNENLHIVYTLTKVEKCTGTETIIETLNIMSGVSYVLPITLDGYYEIKLASTEFVNTFSNIYITYFINYQASMIEDIFTILCPCDCGCTGCTDLGINQYQTIITTTNKIGIYKHLTSPQYESVLKEVHQEAECLIVPQIYCDITQEGITGQSEYNEKLTKQLIALNYLAMYFWDLKNVTDQEEIDYINDKYKSEEILCCINTLGVNINNIKQIVEDMATITINTAIYVNLAPNAVGDLTINLPNRGTHIFSVSDFTQAPYDPLLPNPNNVPNNALSTVRILSFGGTAPLGELKLGGVIQTVFPFDVLEAELVGGQFVYTGPGVDVIDDDAIGFEISNVGAPTLFTA